MNITCDTCNGEYDTDLHFTCPVCKNEENKIMLNDIDRPEIQAAIEADPREQRIVEISNKLSKSIPTDRYSYFVGRIESIVDIERELIDAGLSPADASYKLAEIVEKNLEILKDNIRKEQAELQADTRYLNMIVPTLREAEREKFKLYDITYKPSTIKPQAATSGTSKPRVSATDKAYESMAKMLGLTVEQYKLSLSNAMKNVTGAVCTCASTPGLCKVHPKE